MLLGVNLALEVGRFYYSIYMSSWLFVFRGFAIVLWENRWALGGVVDAQLEW